jgi:outer membrane biosynthesis protein TonB
MFKVLEVHSAYISTALTLIFHLLIGFYLLYILKTAYVDYLPSGGEKRVVWYQAPSTTPTVPTQTVYEQPIQESATAQATEYAEIPFQEVVSPERKGRSAEQRRSAWTKKTVTEDPQDKPLTAATFMEAISKDQATKRQAQAVYTKEQAIKQGVAAQMREITDGRLRNKIFSALKIACSLNKKEYYAPMPVDTTIITSLVINQKGEIVAVEVLKSTGTPALDEHIAHLLQSIKKIALPPSRSGQDFYTQTFKCRVTCPAGSGHFEFSYDEGSGIHIM